MGLSELRKLLNDNAELSWKEFKTTDILCNFFESKGIGCRKLSKTGLIVKKGLGKRLLFRAELDALPFDKEVLHACGHDVHAGALAYALVECKEPIIGIFQPSEEDYPSGAKYVLDELDEDYSAAIAVHVDPSLPIGKVGVRAGCVMGSVDLIRIKVRGKAAHTATPNEGKDAIVASADIICRINEAFQSDNCSVVISKIKGGEKDNIVCDKVELVGTSRALDEGLRFKIKDKISEICSDISDKQRIKVDFEFVEGYPSLHNNSGLAKRVWEVLEEELGVGNVVENDVRLSNDDFAFFGEKAPICLIRVGCGEGRLHSKDFYPNGEVVEICRKVFVTCSKLSSELASAES